MAILKDIISKYADKINERFESIVKFKEMITEAENGSGMDVDDLKGELENIHADRRIYIQFVKDLNSIS